MHVGLNSIRDFFTHKDLVPTLWRGPGLLVRSTLTLIFQPRGPNFFLSWMMAWKKQIPNTSLRHVTPRTVTQRQKTNVTGLERVNQLHSLISGMLNSNHEGSTQQCYWLVTHFFVFFWGVPWQGDRRWYKKSMTRYLNWCCVLTWWRVAGRLNNNAPLNSTYYWFARDITAAMLVAKKKAFLFSGI